MQRAKRKARAGVVVSNKMDKTAIVEIERTFAHPFYQKVIRTKHRFAVHDEKNECQIGDKVLISETKPLSKTKRWRIVKVTGKKYLVTENDTSTNKA